VKIEIKNRFTGNILFSVKTKNIKLAVEAAIKQDADLHGADLQGAYLQDAYLRGANLRGADLQGADLQGADLQDAYLRGADLRGADLRGADLRGADLQNIPHLTHLSFDSFIKKYKIKKRGNSIIAYKGVTNALESPMQDNKIKYEIGKIIKTDYLNYDIFTDCGHGINVSPTIELAKQWGDKVIEVEIPFFKGICIPLEHTKFRVKECKVIREIEK